MEETKGEDPWVYLGGVSNDIEAKIILSILKNDGIPVIKKYREAGGFLQIYMGMTSFGIDLHVPAGSLQRAKTLLKEAESEDEQPEMPG